MWKVIKNPYTNVKAQVLYAGSLSRKIDVSQGTGQGRILAPFMYKSICQWAIVCANQSLLCDIHKWATNTLPIICR